MTNELFDLSSEDTQSRADFERRVYWSPTSLLTCIWYKKKEILQDHIKMCENEIVVSRMNEEANK